MSRYIKWACAIVVAMTFTISALADAGTERRFSAGDVQADFRELYARLEASHFDLYARRPKPEYEALYRSMLGSFTRPLTAFEIRVQFQKFMAFGRVAHSRIDFPSEAYGAYRDAGGKTMPVTLRVVRGRAYVNENGSGLNNIAPGDEILALNGEPLEAWLKRLGANVSADNDYMLNTLLENRLPALLWLELGSVNQFKLSLRNARGTFEVLVPARTRDEIKAATQQSQTLDLDWDKRSFSMLGYGVGYLRPGPSYNNDPNATNIWDTIAFHQFIDTSFEALLAAHAKSLVIDLRDNPGGDNSFSDLMVGWFATKPFRFASAFNIKVSEAAIASNQKRILPKDTDAISQKLADAYAKAHVGDVISFEIPMAYPRAGARFTGKVYLLIDRHSYSNTVQVAALAQDYGFATIIGEETSDLATTYGAMEQFALSRTGIDVGFPKARIIRANGDRKARGVIPDIAIETPIVQGKDDPVLARAVEIAKQGR